MSTRIKRSRPPILEGAQTQDCIACGLPKVISPDPSVSDFRMRSPRKDGSIRFYTRCMNCTRIYNNELSQDPERRRKKAEYNKGPVARASEKAYRVKHKAEISAYNKIRKSTPLARLLNSRYKFRASLKRVEAKRKRIEADLAECTRLIDLMRLRMGIDRGQVDVEIDAQ